MAALWQQLLAVGRVGRHDNFFELGGHSLLAVRFLSRLHATLGVELRMATLFAREDIAALAQEIEEIIRRGDARALLPIARVSQGGLLALSFAQQRLWFLAQLERASTSYHIRLAMRLRGTLDRQALRRSLDRLVARHDALRSMFVSEGGVPHVELLPADVGFALVEEDVEHAHDVRQRLDVLSAKRRTRRSTSNTDR